MAWAQGPRSTGSSDESGGRFRRKRGGAVSGRRCSSWRPAPGACSRWPSRAPRTSRCGWRWRPPSARQRWRRWWPWPFAAGAGAAWPPSWRCSPRHWSGIFNLPALERPRLGGRERRAAARHDPGRPGHRAQHPQLRLPQRDRLHPGLLRQDLRPAPARRRGPRGHLLDGAGGRAHLPQLRLRRRRPPGRVHRDAQGKGRGLFHRQGLLPPVRAVLRGGRRARRDPACAPTTARTRRSRCTSTASRAPTPARAASSWTT